MPRAPRNTHTKPDTHTHTHTQSDSPLLYSGRGEWLTCGKISPGCREGGKKASEAVLCGMKTAMMANILLLITACLLCPPPAFTRPYQPPPRTQSSPPFSSFLTPHLPLFLLHFPRASAAEPATLKRGIKQKKGTKKKGFPQKRGWEGECR